MRIIVMMLLYFCANLASSQNAASASFRSSATVVEPIQITKNVDLNFGNIISGYSAGKVILTPDGNRTAFGVQMSPGNPGAFSPAEALVQHGSYDYSLTLPDSFTLYNETNPDQTLQINEFKVAPANAGEESDLLKIGATLNVQANQRSGNYTNPAGFNVTVSYN